MPKNDFGKLIVSENNLQSFILKLPEGLIFDTDKVVTPEGKKPLGYKFAINGVKYCLYYKEHTGFDLEASILERNRLMVLNNEPEKLKAIKNKISYFEYGYET